MICVIPLKRIYNFRHRTSNITAPPQAVLKMYLYMLGLNMLHQVLKMVVEAESKKTFREFIESLGYESEEEFVREALEDKVLELKKRSFFEISDKVKDALIKKGISEKEILKAFGD